MAPQPTHHAKHNDGWEANIYIAPSLQKQLVSRNVDVRLNAYTSVCIRVRKALEAKHGDKFRHGHKFVEWGHFTLTPLAKPAAAVKADLVKTAVAPITHDYPEDDCDDCAVCDIGNHHQCSNCSG